jgi:hypothetical protein
MGLGVLEAVGCAFGHHNAVRRCSRLSAAPAAQAAPGTAAAGSPVHVRSATELAMQAEEFQRMVLEDAMDDQGFVRHHLRADRRPLADSDLLKERTDREERIATGKECHPLLGSPAYAMYEDANYCGNRFLMAMIWRQLALGSVDRAGKVATDRAYQASILPAQLGAGLEPGYWPKPCEYMYPPPQPVVWT